MPKLVLPVFLTLDGVMQGPGTPDEDRSNGFEHGGWLVPYADDDMMRIMVEQITQADGFLLGRKTYEIFAAHWPHVTDPGDPVATSLNSRPKYVASTTLDKVDWNNSRLIKGDIVSEVAALKRQPGTEIQIQGSGNLAQTLMRHGLVDEYRLWIYPVVLGTGKRLFADGAVPAALEHVSATMTSTGVVFHTYKAAGKPQYGSFALDQ